MDSAPLEARIFRISNFDIISVVLVCVILKFSNKIKVFCAVWNQRRIVQLSDKAEQIKH